VKIDQFLVEAKNHEEKGDKEMKQTLETHEQEISEISVPCVPNMRRHLSAMSLMWMSTIYL
jgi:hypothetical protein